MAELLSGLIFAGLCQWINGYSCNSVCVFSIIQWHYSVATICLKISKLRLCLLCTYSSHRKCAAIRVGLIWPYQRRRQTHLNLVLCHVLDIISDKYLTMHRNRGCPKKSVISKNLVGHRRPSFSQFGVLMSSTKPNWDKGSQTWPTELLSFWSHTFWATL